MGSWDEEFNGHVTEDDEPESRKAKKFGTQNVLMIQSRPPLPLKDCGVSM